MTELSVPQFKRWWVDRFWTEFFELGRRKGCWEWKGQVNRRGYGRISLDGQNHFVHRIAYMIYYREHPGELLVRHKCDNPRCCNPFHLELGTHQDNSRDMVERGRSQKGKVHWTKRMPERYQELREKGLYKSQTERIKALNGENHPCTKMTAEKVLEIRERSRRGASDYTLAKEFGVTHTNISAIVLGKSWAHVEGAVKKRSNKSKFKRKLTPALVRDIRNQVANGRAVWSIAKELKMSPTTIDKVVKRISWKHVE